MMGGEVCCCHDVLLFFVLRLEVASAGGGCWKFSEQVREVMKLHVADCVPVADVHCAIVTNDRGGN